MHHPEDLDAQMKAWLESSEPSPETGEPTRNWTIRVAAMALALLTLAGFVVLWPAGTARQSAEERLSVLGVPSEFYPAEVASVEQASCSASVDLECTAVGFLLEDGPHQGEVYAQEFPPGDFTPDFTVGQTAILSYRPPGGRVLEAQDLPCSFSPDVQCRLFTILIGEDPGTLATYEAEAQQPEASLERGDEVSVTLIEGEPGSIELVGISIPAIAAQYRFADFQRRPLLLAIGAAFVLAVLLLGRRRGLAALAGLGLSVVVILAFVVPAILEGQSPVWVAVVGATGIAFVALYLAHGFSDKTTVALLGTVGALISTALLSTAVIAVSNLSGLASDESGLLTFFEGIDVQGLVLAGIVLGAAGALDDVTVTQASAVWELKSANPQLLAHDLWQRGLRIGRDHIASTVNTLLLAYAGAALPILILFVLSTQSLGDIANSEVVAIEIIRTLVGSIGLVAAVPLTTWLAARTAARR